MALAPFTNELPEDSVGAKIYSPAHPDTNALGKAAGHPIAAGDFMAYVFGRSDLLGIYSYARPADGNIYAAGDVVINATSGAAQPNIVVASFEGGGGLITGIGVCSDKVDAATLTHQPRLHLFKKTRATKLQDNDPFTLTYAQAITDLKRLTSLTLPVMTKIGSSGANAVSISEQHGLGIAFACEADDTKLYIDHEALVGYTPLTGTLWTVALFGTLN